MQAKHMTSGLVGLLQLHSSSVYVTEHRQTACNILSAIVAAAVICRLDVKPFDVCLPQQLVVIPTPLGV